MRQGDIGDIHEPEPVGCCSLRQVFASVTAIFKGDHAGTKPAGLPGTQTIYSMIHSRADILASTVEPRNAHRPPAKLSMSFQVSRDASYHNTNEGAWPAFSREPRKSSKYTSDEFGREKQQIIVNLETGRRAGAKLFNSIGVFK